MVITEVELRRFELLAEGLELGDKEHILKELDALRKMICEESAKEVEAVRRQILNISSFFLGRHPEAHLRTPDFDRMRHLVDLESDFPGSFREAAANAPKPVADKSAEHLATLLGTDTFQAHSKAAYIALEAEIHGQSHAELSGTDRQYVSEIVRQALETSSAKCALN